MMKDNESSIDVINRNLKEIWLSMIEMNMSELEIEDRDRRIIGKFSVLVKENRK